MLLHGKLRKHTQTPIQRCHRQRTFICSAKKMQHVNNTKFNDNQESTDVKVFPVEDRMPKSPSPTAGPLKQSNWLIPMSKDKHKTRRSKNTKTHKKSLISICRELSWERKTWRLKLNKSKNKRHSTQNTHSNEKEILIIRSCRRAFSPE